MRSNSSAGIPYREAASSTATIKTVSKKSAVVETISREVKTFTEEQHLKVTNASIKELYNQFKEFVLSISSEITVKPQKQYIAFRSKSNIADVCVLRNALKIFLNLKKGKLDESKKLTRDVSNIGHWGNGEYELRVDSEDELEYVISLVRQSYKLNKE